ncbi:MAG: class I SAM-dependent methyltransferase [Chloroflexi bacterium]|nr:class I SAM-dependent methyltransferase [Chloroflexota bacterium]
MHLLDLVRRAAKPGPWAEGDNIPWHDPAFSRRMLAEHLSQAHDAASRRFETVDRHVRWVHAEVLGGRATRVLDLGCGPGLYTTRLARLGHECLGIDYSPASIAYATRQATADNLRCTYRLEDVRLAGYGSGFGLVTLIYGELNVFRPADARLILGKAQTALEPGGALLLEPHTFAAVHDMGKQPRSWHSSAAGLFSDRPHVSLEERSWDPATATATMRYYVVDAATGEVTCHAQSLQAYSDAQYRDLLRECGYGEVTFFPSLSGDEPAPRGGLFAILARKVP